VARGAALWIAVPFIAWLVRGRQDRPQPFTEMPGDTSRHELGRPLIMFAVIRAVAIGGAVAIAFGLDLAHGYWLPIAAIVSIKPSFEQTQECSRAARFRRADRRRRRRAAAAHPANEHGLHLFTIERGLEVVALVLLMHAAGIRFWNYAVYYAAITAAVLTLMDLPQPSNYRAEGDRVLWALCGAAIGMLVMFLAELLATCTAKAPPGQPADVPAPRKTTAEQDMASKSGHRAEPGMGQAG
jgi:uncharacterized membrane protein YccC